MSKKSEIERFLDFIQNNFIKLIAIYALMVVLCIGGVAFTVYKVCEIYTNDVSIENK